MKMCKSGKTITYRCKSCQVVIYNIYYNDLYPLIRIFNKFLYRIPTFRPYSTPLEYGKTCRLYFKLYFGDSRRYSYRGVCNTHGDLRARVR